MRSRVLAGIIVSKVQPDQNLSVSEGPEASLKALVEVVRRARLYKIVAPAGLDIQMHQLMQVGVVFSLSDEQVERDLSALLASGGARQDEERKEPKD